MRLIAMSVLLLLSLSEANSGVTVDENMNINDLVGARRLTFDEKGEFLFGDIIINKAEVSELGAVTFLRWTEGKIVYQFDASLTPAQRQTFIGACNAWTTGTPLTCVERTNQNNFIRVRTHNGEQCGGPWNSCSALGMHKGGQDLWIYKAHWNGYSTVIQHEVGHAIGLMHEHQRPDRDNYVLILEDNIQSGAESQFWKSPYAVSGASDYDFDSIMHYHNCDFSKYENCAFGEPDSEQTIQALSCSRDGVGGDSITALDREAVSRAYSSDFLSLFARDRNEACGNVAYTEAQWAGICANGSCAAESLPQKRWKKEVTRDYKTCGFISAGKELAMCAEIKREYIESWTDTDPFSCSFGGDLHELWSKCGCSYVDEKSLCTDYDKPAYSDYQKASGNVNWRQGRAIYFLDIAHELAADGLLADDVIDGLTKFVLENYEDRRFETRLARMRTGIYSYARWKRSVNPSYKLDLATFNKIATRHHLRALG